MPAATKTGEPTNYRLPDDPLLAMTKADYDRFVATHGRPHDWYPHHSHRQRLTAADTAEPITPERITLLNDN